MYEFRVWNAQQRTLVHDKSRISTDMLARKLINAARLFKDKVFDKICTLEDESAVFAADLEYHRVRMRKYVKSYEDHVKIVIHNLEVEESISSSDCDVIEAFNNVMERVDINSQAHSVSDIREQINFLLTEQFS